MEISEDLASCYDTGMIVQVAEETVEGLPEGTSKTFDPAAFDRAVREALGLPTEPTAVLGATVVKRVEA